MKSIDYWRLADELTVIQAALLICGYDPSDIQDEVKYGRTKFPEGYVAIKHAISTAIKAKLLPARSTMVLDERQGEYYPDDDLALIEVNFLKTWLNEKGINKHFFFFPNGVEDEFLDQNNPRYSPKLAAAVRAWKAMEGESISGRTPKQAVMKWLRLHAETYGLTDEDGKPLETAISEIAKIVNWNPKGGAPSTPSEAGSAEPIAGSKALEALDENFAVLQEKKFKSTRNFDFFSDDDIPF